MASLASTVFARVVNRRDIDSATQARKPWVNRYTCHFYRLDRQPLYISDAHKLQTLLTSNYSFLCRSIAFSPPNKPFTETILRASYKSRTCTYQIDRRYPMSKCRRFQVNTFCVCSVHWQHCPLRQPLREL